MKISTKQKFKRFVTIIITWMIVGFFISLYDYLVINSYYTNGPSAEYTFLISITRNVGAGLIGGILGGGILVLIQERLQDKPYAYSILIVAFSFLGIVISINLIMRYAIPLFNNYDNSQPSAMLDAKIFDKLSIKAAIAWSFIVAATQLLLQINNKFGDGVFFNLLIGRYNTPKKEDRVFMFIDLNSSTEIAERLGDKSYHDLLRDFYADITKPIIENKGHIYQYVGDEAVISWKHHEGIENGNCVKCFFDIKKEILTLKPKYESKYGLVPAFKAGIHCGSVIAGEIGLVKRDITYSGDVLNTTSRILGMCKPLKVDLLLSQEVITEIGADSKFNITHFGTIPLRGKKKEVALATLQVA